MQKTKKATPNNNEPKNKNKNNRVLLIAVCAFLAVIIGFSSVFGIVIAVRNSKAAVKLGSVYINEGVTAVLASYYKDLHITALKRSGYPEATDTEYFWNSMRDDGKTQGEVYISSLKNYIAGIMAGCNLVGGTKKLTKEDKELIEEKTSAFISYYGSKEAFEKEAAKYGFNYDDFCRAMELVYTSKNAMLAMYGYQGANLKSQTAEALLQREEYLGSYSRVKLLFLCENEITEEDENGEITTRPLSAAESEERRAIADSLRDAMKCAQENTDGAITETMFDYYLKKSDGDPERHSKGYYFRDTAEQTAKFYELYPEVVNKAFSMEIGEYAEVDCAIGVCFIYKCAPESLSYQDEEDPFFSDFYSDAAEYFYTKALEVLVEEVEFRDRFYSLDFIKTPVNNNLFITSWN